VEFSLHQADQALGADDLDFENLRQVLVGVLKPSLPDDDEEPTRRRPGSA